MLFFKKVPFHSRAAYYYDHLSGLLFGFFNGAVLLFIPVVARKIGASDTQLAIITGIGSVTLLFTFFWTYLGISRTKMQIIVWTKYIGRSLFLFMPFVYNPVLFTAITAAFALLDAIANPAYSTIMKKIYTEKFRARSMAYVRVISSTTMLAASFIGGKLLDIWGKTSYRIVFPIGTVFGLLSAFYFSKIPLKEYIPEKTQPVSLTGIFREWADDKTILKLGLMVSIAGFGNIMMSPLSPIYLVDNLNVSLTFVGIMNAAAALVTVISYYFWGDFIDKKGPMLSFNMIFIALVFVPILYISGTKLTVFISALLSAFSVAGWDLAWLKFITIRAPSSEKVHIYSGFYFSLMGIRGTLAPFVAVWIMNLAGIKFSFFISFAMILSGFIISMAWKKNIGKELAVPVYNS